MAITPAWTRKRPAPRRAPGPPQPIHDQVVWTRVLDGKEIPRERYRIVYRDRDNALSERLIELLKVGTLGGHIYYSVMHAGKPKTLRSDRIVTVIEQLSEGHPPTLQAQPTYASRLPAFPPIPGGAVFKIPASAANSKRSWTVDLNAYTCTCPEKRIRGEAGYEPGTLGYVCDHMARAILEHLPPDAAWPHPLLAFIQDPRKIAIDNLT